jgi:hypothetical protein
MAVAQSQLAARLITERTGHDEEPADVTMFGDVSRAQPAKIGGTGMFVSAPRGIQGLPLKRLRSASILAMPHLVAVDR